MQPQQDMNYLRKLLASGQITQSDLSDMQMSGSFDSPPPQMQQPEPQQPPMQNALAQMLQSAQPGQGYQGLQSGQGVIQQTNEDGSQNAPIRVDSRRSQQPQMPERDVTRNPVDLPGGRGYYGKDGQVYTANGSLYQTPETQAQNRALSMAAQDRQLKIQEMQGRMKLTDAQTQNAILKPTAPTGSKGQIIDGQYVEFGPDGRPSASAIPGFQPKEKASTEDEKKAAGWGIRMENALRTMDGLGKANPEAVKPQMGATLAGRIPLIGDMAENKLNTSPRRQIEATQLDALDAALTLATGAAYTKEQLKNLSKSYFPQIGDEAGDISAKKKLLENVIQTARIRAGNSAGNIDKVLGPRSESNSAPVNDGKYDADKEKRYEAFKRSRGA